MPTPRSPVALPRSLARFLPKRVPGERAKRNGRAGGRHIAQDSRPRPPPRDSLGLGASSLSSLSVQSLQSFAQCRAVRVAKSRGGICDEGRSERTTEYKQFVAVKKGGTVSVVLLVDRRLRGGGGVVARSLARPLARCPTDG